MVDDSEPNLHELALNVLASNDERLSKKKLITTTPPTSSSSSPTIKTPEPLAPLLKTQSQESFTQQLSLASPSSTPPSIPWIAILSLISIVLVAFYFRSYLFDVYDFCSTPKRKEVRYINQYNKELGSITPIYKEPTIPTTYKYRQKHASHTPISIKIRSDENNQIHIVWKEGHHKQIGTGYQDEKDLKRYHVQFKDVPAYRTRVSVKMSVWWTPDDLNQVEVACDDLPDQRLIFEKI